MRILSLFFPLLAAGSAFNVAELSDFIDSYWRAKTEGNAAAFVSHLDSGFKQFINGEEDKTPWTDVTYVHDLFQKVTFPAMTALSSVVSVEPNKVIVVIEWDIALKDTLDTLPMGEWQQTYTFTPAGKIKQISSICDGEHVQKYSDLLSTQLVEYRPAFESLLNAFNTKNVQGVLSAFAEEVYWRRNGKNDSFTWTRPRFLGFLFQENLVVKLDTFASSVPRTSYAVMTWTHTSNIDKKVTIVPDSWFITWNPDGKISHVRSVTNGQEGIIYANLMPAIQASLSPQSKAELQRLIQSGTFDLAHYHKHLDL